MPEYLSKEEVKQWRRSLEKITLEEYAARLGKLIEEDKLKNIARHSDIGTTQGYLISDEQGELEDTFGIKFTD